MVKSSPRSVQYKYKNKCHLAAGWRHRRLLLPRFCPRYHSGGKYPHSSKTFPHHSYTKLHNQVRLRSGCIFVSKVRGLTGNHTGCRESSFFLNDVIVAQEGEDGGTWRPAAAQPAKHSCIITKVLAPPSEKWPILALTTEKWPNKSLRPGEEPRYRARGWRENEYHKTKNGRSGEWIMYTEHLEELYGLSYGDSHL